MGRFDFSGPYAVRPIHGAGKLLAMLEFVDAETGLVFRDFQLFESANGPFVKADQRVYEKNGEVKRIPHVQPAKDNVAGRRWFREVADAAYQAYEAFLRTAPNASEQRRSVRTVAE